MNSDSEPTPDTSEALKEEATGLYDRQILQVQAHATPMDPVTADDVYQVIALVIHYIETKYPKMDDNDVEGIHSHLKEHAFSQTGS